MWSRNDTRYGGLHRRTFPPPRGRCLAVRSFFFRIFSPVRFPTPTRKSPSVRAPESPALRFSSVYFGRKPCSRTVCDTTIHLPRAPFPCRSPLFRAQSQQPESPRFVNAVAACSSGSGPSSSRRLHQWLAVVTDTFLSLILLDWVHPLPAAAPLSSWQSLLVQSTIVLFISIFITVVRRLSSSRLRSDPFWSLSRHRSRATEILPIGESGKQFVVFYLFVEFEAHACFLEYEHIRNDKYRSRPVVEPTTDGTEGTESNGSVLEVNFYSKTRATEERKRSEETTDGDFYPYGT